MLAANDWLLFVIVELIVVILPENDDDVVVAADDTVVIDDANDAELLLAVVCSPSIRLAADELFVETVPAMVVMEELNDADEL